MHYEKYHFKPEERARLAFNSLSEAMIITYEDEETTGRDGLEIEVVPIWKWILEE